MPSQARIAKPVYYKKRKLDRAPISPYARGPNTQVRRSIASAIGVENKYFDIEVAAAITASLTYGNLTTLVENPQIAVGDEVFQRNGRQILLKRVTFRGNVFTTPITAQTSAAPCTSGRLILWRNDQFAPPQTNFIGKADGTAFSSIAVALGGFQAPNANGYGKIVDDMQFTLVPTASVNNATGTTVSSTAAEVPVMLSYTPKKPIKLLYQAATATAIPDKWFTILGIVDATTFQPSLNGIMRFYYTDA